MFRDLWRKKVLVVFVIALLILFPAASVRPTQAASKTIFFAVGIEKSADGYTVIGIEMESGSSQGNSSASKIISADGATVPEALEKVTTHQGRKVSLAHCNSFVIGKTLSMENVAEILRYFLEKFEVSNNALLVWTDSPVEKVLEKSMATKTAAAGGLLETVAAYNQKHVFKRPVTLDGFYKDYLHGRDAFMCAVLLEDDEIFNTEQMAVFKDGKFIEVRKKLYR